MKILMVSAESVPFAKTGGLADAVPALARALDKQGHDVGILMPLYRTVDRTELKPLSEPLGIPMGDQEMWCAVHQTRLPGSHVSVWMIEREDLFGREGLYGPDGSSSWPDNALRFAFLSAASFQLSRYLNRIPDILHLHDWQAAPAAWMLKKGDKNQDFRNTASVLTVHNLGYQGVFPASNRFVFPLSIPENDGMFHNGAMNFLSGGLKHADAITTVSPTYAKEILLPEFSEGLENILGDKTDKISGILNGMDYSEWNPSTDAALKPYNYDRYSLRRKSKVKKRLQEEAGLPVNPDIPVFGMITRLTSQKGVDLLDYPESPALELFRKGQAQLIVLGTGERRYEDGLRNVSTSYGNYCSVRIAFSNSYSRLIEAGSDFFLMPSRYEPCGLNQMYSLRYGTLPIVRRTGGLADTVTDLLQDEKNGNGFIFDHPDPQELNAAIQNASVLYANRRKLNAVRRRAMALRFDWDSSAARYEKVYKEVFGHTAKS